MTPTRSHELAFGFPAPMGTARCRACWADVTLAQFFREECKGKGEVLSPLTPAAPDGHNGLPLRSGSLCCRLCSAPLLVDDRHRAVVALFGSTCDACAGVPV